MRLLIPFLTLLLAGCANLSLNDVYRNPSFSYQSTQIRGVNFDQLNGSSIVSISNSNPYNLPVSALSAELWLEGKPWLDLGNDAVQGLPASDTIDVSLNWSLVFDALLQRAASVYEQGEANFTLKMTPTLEVPVLGPKSLNWSADFSVPIPKMPKARLTDWQVTGVSFTKVSLLLDIEVDNPNVFSIATQGWNLGVSNSSRSLASLDLRDATISAGKASSQQVEVSLSIVDVGLAVVDALQSGRWPSSLQMDWDGNWQSPELDFDLPALAGSMAFN